MIGDFFLISEKHTNAAQTVFQKIISDIEKNSIITISGEVGSGKCSVSYELAKKLRENEMFPMLINLDNYYKIPPIQRNSWRMKHGIDSVGYDEYDWKTIQKNIQDFRNKAETQMPVIDLFNGKINTLNTNFKGIDFLIISGLYATKIEEADLKVFIELTYKETLEIQKKIGKEKLDDFRLKVLEKEHEVVQSLKSKANFYIDFDTSMEFYHV